MRVFPRISEIMTTNLLTVHPEDDMTVVEKAFEEHHYHHLPVVEAEKLVGIISKSDYLYFIHGNSIDSEEFLRLKQYKANEIMTTGLATLQSDLRFDVCIQLFTEIKFHSLPIVDDGKLVGMVTTHDVIMWMSKELL
jgi:CBS domain-containing protein